jgi:hypothetical protein
MIVGTSIARGTLLITTLTLLAPSLLQAQTGFTPPPPHVNAPPAEIKRMPGDGNGPYKTGNTASHFAEQGHPAATKAKPSLEKLQQLFHGDAVPSASTSKPAKTKTAPRHTTDWANNDAPRHVHHAMIASRWTTSASSTPSELVQHLHAHHGPHNPMSATSPGL